MSPRKWDQGRAVISDLIRAGHLQQVPPSRDHAEVLLAQARACLRGGKDELSDPMTAYVILYDGARRALAAVLENQGLRATSRGGHIALREAVNAQLDPPLGKIVRPFEQMRLRRNDVEYPAEGMVPVTASEAREAAGHAEAIIGMAGRLLDEMHPWS